MIGRIEEFFRGLRRRVGRTEWTLRRLRLPRSDAAGHEPGLLLIQIDGLARAQMERAMAKGRLPFLKSLLTREHYELGDFYPGLPSSTPAVQAELHYGVRCAVPAFSFLDRESHRIAAMFKPEWAKKIEADLSARSEGLLRGGSSWSNIYSGGATTEESHFCASSIGLGDMMRGGSGLAMASVILLNIPALLRLVGLLIAEFALSVWDLIAGVARGENWMKELKFVLARVFVCVGLREVITLGCELDLTRGSPVVHVNYLGYDEQAHRRGPDSKFAHWSLKGIDQSARRLFRASQRSTHRDYLVWIFSDHGQETSESFSDIVAGGLQNAVAACLEKLAQPVPLRTVAPRVHGTRADWAGGRRASRRLTAEAAASSGSGDHAAFSLATMGPVAHGYFPKTLRVDQRKELAAALIETGVPAIMFIDANDSVRWIQEDGCYTLPQEKDRLFPHPPPIRAEIAEDLIQLCRHRDAGDLVFLGWTRYRPTPATFAIERGAHAGPGVHETRGFTLLPTRTRMPERAGAHIRASDLRAAALHVLHREPLAPRLAGEHVHDGTRLRIMTYNVHGCRGMDGKTLPKRIARSIERFEPDIVALQEIDHGRPRSRHDDQSEIIAAELGMHVSFCPTLVTGTEEYGHAILSRMPMTVVHTAHLPTIEPNHRTKRSREPRAAQWIRVDLGGKALHLINTHLGLNRRERALQVRHLLGSEWIGSVPARDPIILCGDLNLTPHSPLYRQITARLIDTDGNRSPLRARRTFPAIHPISRLDYVFVSDDFRVDDFQVPRNHLTRVASDHLPVLVDLMLKDD